MEKAEKENGDMQRRKNDPESIDGSESLTESAATSRESGSSRSSCDTWAEEAKANKARNRSISIEVPSPRPLGWPIRKAQVSKCSSSNAIEDESNIRKLEDSKLEKQETKVSEIEVMKERFAKLLLGEDMSGSGKGVCTALAISNAITNLCATIFGQLWRLEPLKLEKKTMWLREMEVLICVSDHIVEFIPSSQTFPDGSKLEVMTCRPRSDLLMNLPALRKLDNMLLEILDSFSNTEFWYVDQGIMTSDADVSASFRKTIQRQEEKWWLPVPRVPPGGLSENSRKQLIHRRECSSQILKAAMAINSIALTDMEVPDSYLESLPKNGRACLGDIIYRYIISDQFSPECLLDCVNLSSDHIALEIANRVEASIYVWRKRINSKSMNNNNPNRSVSKSSWGMVKELMVDGDKRELLMERAETLLVCLKQRVPGLSQTALDTSKIQCNKDIGKSILESYSRVLESLASNIVARIDDILYVDDLSKQAGGRFSSIPKVSVISHKRIPNPQTVPILGTPYKTTFSTPSFSPAPLVSPAKGERTPFLLNGPKPHRRGFGVRRALTNYLGIDTKAKTEETTVVLTSNLNVPPSRKESVPDQNMTKVRQN